MLDWKKWKKSGLSLIQFLLLSLIYQDSVAKLPFNPKSELTEEGCREVFNFLVAEDYLREGEIKYYLTPKSVELFSSEQGNFKEFFELFPQKVPNNRGGERALRAVSITAQNSNEAFRKWKMITAGNEDKERHIIACLAVEITQRQKQGDLPFMHNIITWLNKKNWEMYEHLIDVPLSASANKEKSI